MVLRIFVLLTFLACSPAGNAASYKIMLMGDSTVKTLYLPVKDQVQTKLKEKLKAALPELEFTVVNAGQGGESIGPGAKSNLIEADLDGYHAYGRYDQITRVNKDIDFVFIRYGTNDKNYYSAAEFKLKLKNLCEKLKKDYPGVKIAVETAMYVDPKHAVRQDPNENTKPVFDAIRQFAKEESCYLVDVQEALKAATDAGNWDLRIRSDKVTVDDSKDAEHANDATKEWWNNIHPNARGLDIIASAEAELVVKIIKGTK